MGCRDKRARCITFSTAWQIADTTRRYLHEGPFPPTGANRLPCHSTLVQLPGVGGTCHDRAMRLRPGVTALRVLESLRSLDTELGNILPSEIPDSYLKWVENAEVQLRNLFADDTLADGLLSQRYFHIRQLIPNSVQARRWPLVDAERALQKSRLDQTVSELKTYAALAERPGHPLVLDTHVFLHYTLFHDVDWVKEFECEHARLIVPLIVLDELDDKTFSHNKRLARRADKVLRAFDGFLETMAADGVSEVRKGVTVEILGDDVSHQRRTNSDSEIIDRAQFFHQVIEKPVTMVTGDRGLRVRSKARSIQVVMMPAHLRLLLEEELETS